MRAILLASLMLSVITIYADDQFVTLRARYERGGAQPSNAEWDSLSINKEDFAKRQAQLKAELRRQIDSRLEKLRSEFRARNERLRMDMIRRVGNLETKTNQTSSRLLYVENEVNHHRELLRGLVNSTESLKVSTENLQDAVENLTHSITRIDHEIDSTRRLSWAALIFSLVALAIVIFVFIGAKGSPSNRFRQQPQDQDSVLSSESEPRFSAPNEDDEELNRLRAMFGNRAHTGGSPATETSSEEASS